MQDAEMPDLMFVGLEFGVWFTVDGGSSWTRLRGGIPTPGTRPRDPITRDRPRRAHDGVTRVAVEREADSLAAAIRSAIADVESIPGVRVERVEPDEYVSQVEIAARLGRSRQSVSQLVSGARGRGDFPAPAFESGRVALWRWSEVSEWLASAGLMADRNEHSSRVIGAANAVLAARRAVAPLNGAERSSLTDLFAA